MNGCRPYADHYDHDYSDEDRRPKTNRGEYYLEVSTHPFYDPEKEEGAQGWYKEELLPKDAKEAQGDEEDEPVKSVDEDQVVVELLEKYTTLYAED